MTYNYESNKRWRQAHPEARQAAARRNYAQTQGGPRTGQVWTDAEMDAILAREVSDRELSAKLGRSVKAIHVKRAKLLGGVQ